MLKTLTAMATTAYRYADTLRNVVAPPRETVKSLLTITLIALAILTVPSFMTGGTLRASPRQQDTEITSPLDLTSSPLNHVWYCYGLPGNEFHQFCAKSVRYTNTLSSEDIDDLCDQDLAFMSSLERTGIVNDLARRECTPSIDNTLFSSLEIPEESSDRCPSSFYLDRIWHLANFLQICIGG